MALLTALLTELRRKPVRIGEMTFSPDEQATAVNLIHGKIVTADDRIWIAAAEIARRRLSVATAPVMKGLLLSSLPPMLIAAIPGVAAPWALWCAAGFATIALITSFLLMRRNRSRARQFLTRAGTEGPTAEPMPNHQTAATDLREPNL